MNIVRSMNMRKQETMSEETDADAASPYRDIRAVTRAIDLLEAAADLGAATIGELAAYSGIDRSTLYRLVHTLERKGYLKHRVEDRKISLTQRIVQVSDGVRHDDISTQVISPLMKDLTEAILWPSDFATMAAGRITIQASSHKFSPMSVHRRLIGKARPLLRSALGLAYLSALSRSDLLHTLDVASRVGLIDPPDLATLDNIEQRIAAVHRMGYAASVGLIEKNISAIALPVRLGHKPIGAMNIVFFRTALTPAAAAEAHLDQLRDTIAKAEAILAVQARG